MTIAPIRMLRSLISIEFIAAIIQSAWAGLVDLGNGLVYDNFSDVTWVRDFRTFKIGSVEF